MQSFTLVDVEMAQGRRQAAGFSLIQQVEQHATPANLHVITGTAYCVCASLGGAAAQADVPVSPDCQVVPSICIPQTAKPPASSSSLLPGALGTPAFLLWSIKRCWLDHSRCICGLRLISHMSAQPLEWHLPQLRRLASRCRQVPAGQPC